jgi:quercetin dioxygenase-like cupin family protein
VLELTASAKAGNLPAQLWGGHDPSRKTEGVLFEGPTSFLGKLHAHVTELQPGGGYGAHADKYDVAIIVFSGTVETLGKTLGPGGSVYYAAGELHGMRNVGKEAAKYLVFEFHGANAGRKRARRHAAESPER